MVGAGCVGTVQHRDLAFRLILDQGGAGGAADTSTRGANLSIVSPMNPEAFPTVLAAAKAGAPWAWTRLYEELSGPLLAYARARGANDPADVVGEVFLELARRGASFEGSWDAYRGWAFLVASHRVIDEHRRRTRRREDASAEIPDLPGRDSAEDIVERDETAKQARALLEQLSPDQREVLLLRIYGDLSIEEVARLTGRSVTGVKALQRRGLGALRRNISFEGVSR